MQNEIYSRTINMHPDRQPRGAPNFAQDVILTEEHNGFALWLFTYTDGESDEGEMTPHRWFTERNSAIEGAVALFHQIRLNLGYK